MCQRPNGQVRRQGFFAVRRGTDANTMIVRGVATVKKPAGEEQ